jgi:CheY-specific phosphatase CheX
VEINPKPALQKAACEVLEELAFMLPSRDLNETQQNAPFKMASAVSFSGPVSGKLILAIYGDLLPTIAANMLGDFETPTEFQQTDALRELTHVICGNMLPHLLGDDAVYTIAAPSIIEEEALRLPDHGGAPEQLEIGMEHGRANLMLCLFGNCRPLEQGT